MNFSIASLLSNFPDDKLVAPKVLEKKLNCEDDASLRRLQIALDALEKIGILVKERGKYRRVFEDDVVEGKLRCSSKGFCFAIQDIEGTVWVDGGADEELFALRVKGDSMKDAGILEGDIVIVRRQADAAHGDIVVVLLDNEATVKRLKRSGGSVWLYPANPAYAPIRLIAEDVHILGKVVELRRYMR